MESLGTQPVDKKQIHDILTSQGFDHSKIIDFRRIMHQFPEGELKEFETQKRIRDILVSFGIEDSSIKVSGGSGLVVDIKGLKPANEGDKNIMIAMRGDTDGLKMVENNPHLPYKSQTEYAHMCGHDGHTATLAYAGWILHNNRDNFPTNCTARLLFQPAEETPGGALPMIEDGCLDDVDEVYGMHNDPGINEGLINVREGVVMAAVAGVKITIKGKGGHSSVPHLLADVITAGGAILNTLHTINSRMVESKENFVLAMTQFHGGYCNNVYPDDAFLDGTLRCFNNEVYNLVYEKVVSISNHTAAIYGCTAEVSFYEYYPATDNHPEPTKVLIQVAQEAFGKDKVIDEGLPETGSEDFSYFQQKKPGCYYFLGTAKEGEEKKVWHGTSYDYNDDMLAVGAYLWVKLIENRFKSKIL